MKALGTLKIAPEIQSRLLAMPRTQGLIQSALRFAMQMGLVNKRGEVKSGIKGKIKRAALEVVFKDAEDEVFDSLVSEIVFGWFQSADSENAPNWVLRELDRIIGEDTAA